MHHSALASKISLYAPDSTVSSRHASTPLLVTALTGDAVVVFLSLLCSSWLRFATGLAHLGVSAASVHWTDYMGRVVFGTLLFLLLLPHNRVYEAAGLQRLRLTAPHIVRTSFTWLVAFMALSWLLRIESEVSRVFVVIAFVVTTLCFLLWRGVLASIVRSEPLARLLRKRIVFLGWSSQAASIAKSILSDPGHPNEIVGYVPTEGSGASGPTPLLRPVGRSDEIGTLVREQGVDMVIVADPNASAAETMAAAETCEKEMVEFKVIPSGFEVLLSCLQFQTLSGVPVLGVSTLPLDTPMNALLKRLLDLVGGAVGLILSAPVILWFGIQVYRESPGPIFFRQKRIGRDGRPFWMYKIRSMRVDAEQGGRPGWTVKGDPRCLKIGAFMRRWNIDELPQFWNVFRGDMSLVGPRPERPELIAVFKDSIPHYNARHGIKPGLTGWAQVNGLRGDTDLGERVRYDLHYMESWSLLFDFQIMFLTLFRHANAA